MSVLVVFGATGYVGRHLVQEAASRGHEVTAVARRAESRPGPAGVVARSGSLADLDFVGEVAEGADVLISALPGQALLNALPVLVEVGRRGPRVGVVGGAGSLRVAPDGPLLQDTPEFPDAAKTEAGWQAKVLAELRQSPSDLDWFYLSPAATFGAFAPGERTGHYRVGDDVLVTAGDGSSSIGGADFALAFVDEIEQPAHHNVRFTVGY